MDGYSVFRIGGDESVMDGAGKFSLEECKSMRKDDMTERLSYKTLLLNLTE